MREGIPVEFEQATAADNSNEGARCAVCGSPEVVEYYKKWYWLSGEWRCDEHRIRDFGDEQESER